MKIRGVQVSPTEIEEIIISHCKPYISDVCVAGVSSSNPDRAREGDTHVPRAWVVLTDDGQSAGAQNIIIRVENAVKERLSRPKWLTGGVEVIDKVSRTRYLLLFCQRSGTLMEWNLNMIDPKEPDWEDPSPRSTG